jgi:AsmA protein
VSQLKLGLEGKRGENAIKGELTSPFSGNLETLAFQLPKLAAKLQVANPKLPKGSMQLQLTGAAEADLGKQRAKADIQTRLDESNIQARLALEHFDPMRIGFDVSIDQLDADRYLQAKSPAPAKGGKAGPESPIDFSGLSSLNASGSIKIGRLKAAKVKASNVRLDVKAGGGRIEVNPLSANLYQGSMQGALSATTTPNPRISARQNLSGISIGPLLRDLADKDLLEGRGSVALNVSTQGPTVSTMKKALDGTAAVNLTNGAIKGVNVAAMLRRAQSALGGGIQTQAASTAEQTDFTELTASFNIRDGVAHNDDLSAKSPLLRLGGNGTIDIGASAMDYLAKATVVGTLEGQSGRELSQLKGVTVPIRVAGPFDALKYSLDPKALVTEAAKAQMEQKTEELKQKAGEKFFKGLFPR